MHVHVAMCKFILRNKTGNLFFTMEFSENFLSWNAMDVTCLIHPQNTTGKHYVGWKFIWSKFSLCMYGSWEYEIESCREVTAGVKTKVKGCYLEFLIMALLCWSCHVVGSSQIPLGRYHP